MAAYSMPSEDAIKKSSEETIVRDAKFVQYSTSAPQMNKVNYDDFTILLDVFQIIIIARISGTIMGCFCKQPNRRSVGEEATDAHCQLLLTINIKPHCIAFVKRPSDVMLVRS